jgi:hypothetical protein
MLNEESIAYYRAYEPIGCRDLSTVELLRARGIESYFSGCLTLTLPRPEEESERSEILFVEPNIDVPDLLRQVPTAVRHRVAYVRHVIDARLPPERRLEVAAEYLERYARAHLVITSRLHCALPCLALGTPVLFVAPGHDLDRFGGIRQLLRTPRISERRVVESIPWLNPEPNSDTYRSIAGELEEACR